MTNESNSTNQVDLSGSSASRLARGFGYIGRGFRFLGEHPGLWRYCVLPWLISLLSLGVVGTLLFRYIDDFVESIWARPDSFLVIFWYVVLVLAWGLALVMSVALFVVLATLLAAPFHDLLSERVELLAAGREPPPFSMSLVAKSAARAIGHQLLKLLVWLAIMVPIWILGMLPLIGTPIAAALAFFVTARFLAFDQCDIALARRNMKFGEKWRFQNQAKATVWGFGISVAALLMIPLIGVLVMPIAVVAGTLLVGDIDHTAAAGGAGK